MEIMKKGLTMTSLEVAEITGKKHSHVMRDIREEIESLEKEGLGAESIFGLSDYKDKTGRKLPLYMMGREGAMQIATRYSAGIRRKLIMRLDELENGSLKLPQTYKEALLALVEAEEQKEKLQLEVKAKEKVIDNITKDVDTPLLCKAVTDYINILHYKTKKPHQVIYKDVYSALGRRLNADIPYRKAKYEQSQRDLVIENINYNKEHNLTGEDRKVPFRMKDAKSKISTLEYVIDVLEGGHALIETIAKLAEVGIEEVVQKYNYYRDVDIEE